MLPIIGSKATQYLPMLSQILYQAVAWETVYPSIINSNLNAAFLIQTEEEKKLMDMIMQAVPRCVGQYFTVFYGMFPQTVLQLATSKQPLPAITNRKFEPVIDPIATSISTAPVKKISARFRSLFATHRLHPDLVPREKRADAWFSQLEASEIMLICFEQRIEPDVVSSDNEQLEQDLNQVCSALLKLNNHMHGLVKQPRIDINMLSLDLRQLESLDAMYCVKVFCYILLNESFFKECMRQYHMMHIKRLRKKILQANAESTTLDLVNTN